MKFFSTLTILAALFIAGYAFDLGDIKTTVPLNDLTKLSNATGRHLNFRKRSLETVNPDEVRIQVKNGGSKVVLTPFGYDTNHPSQDTINLEWALNSYPDATINLEAGTFHVSRTIEVVDFQGKIKGEGPLETEIVGRGPLVGSDYEFPLLTQDLQDRLYPSGVPHLIWFHPSSYENVEDWQTHHTDLTLKDLTFRMEGVGPAVTYLAQPLRTIWSMIILTGSNANYQVPEGNVPHVNLDVNNVNFVSEDTAYTLNGVQRSNPNAGAAILYYGGETWYQGVGLNGWGESDHSPVNGQVTISDTNFTNFHQFALGLETLFSGQTTTPYNFPVLAPFPEASVHVEDCRFENIGNGAGLQGSGGFGILVLGTSDTVYTFKDNYFNSPAVSTVFLNGIAEALLKSPSTFNIRDNEFVHQGGAYQGSAVFVLDFFSYLGPHYQMDVVDNSFVGETGYVNLMIHYLMGSHGLVQDNTFSGEMARGVSVGASPSPFDPSGSPLPGTFVNVLGNTFDGTFSDVAVRFGSSSAFCTAVVDDLLQVADTGYSNTVTLA